VSAVPEAEDLSVQARKLLAAGQRAAALDMWRRAITIDPAHPFAYWRIASLSADDPVGAAALLQRQVIMAPSAPAYLHGAFILQPLGRSSEALAMWREGIDRFPGDRNMAALFAEALLRQGRSAEALPLLQHEVTLRPATIRQRLAAPAGGGALPAEVMNAMRDVRLPTFPPAAGPAVLALPWNLACDAGGQCSMAPVTVPRVSPFDVF
jgi:tetratricopeptide (TPR) repeat protein